MEVHMIKEQNECDVRKQIRCYVKELTNSKLKVYLQAILGLNAYIKTVII